MKQIFKLSLAWILWINYFNLSLPSWLCQVKRLKKELVNVRNGRKEAFSMLRSAMQKAAQLRLMEKEKNKSPSCAMRVSVRINKVGWSMLADGKAFSEAEINDIVSLFFLQPSIILSLWLLIAQRLGVPFQKMAANNYLLRERNAPCAVVSGVELLF